MNIKIGDMLLCVKAHNDNIMDKGNIVVVVDFMNCPCCDTTLIDVGHRDFFTNRKCYHCNGLYKNHGGDYWFPAYMFRRIRKLKKYDCGEIPMELLERIERHRETLNKYNDKY